MAAWNWKISISSERNSHKGTFMCSAPYNILLPQNFLRARDFDRGWDGCRRLQGEEEIAENQARTPSACKSNLCVYSFSSFPQSLEFECGFPAFKPNKCLIWNIFQSCLEQTFGKPRSQELYHYECIRLKCKKAMFKQHGQPSTHFVGLLDSKKKKKSCK